MKGFSLPLAGRPSPMSKSLLLPVPQLSLLLLPIHHSTELSSLGIEGGVFTLRNKDIARYWPGMVSMQPFHRRGGGVVSFCLRENMSLLSPGVLTGEELVSNTQVGRQYLD